MTMPLRSRSRSCSVSICWAIHQLPKGIQNRNELGSRIINLLHRGGRGRPFCVADCPSYQPAPMAINVISYPIHAFGAFLPRMRCDTSGNFQLGTPELSQVASPAASARIRASKFPIRSSWLFRTFSICPALAHAPRNTITPGGVWSGSGEKNARSPVIKPELKSEDIPELLYRRSTLETSATYVATTKRQGNSQEIRPL
ncbi:hypothetical protein DSM25559_4444 [Agrobacterium rosae]|uniref:Uncharacterized protein n=1 Tax=Agrobacterium rosae TaxID=1972867 RepID=A0A1R3U0L1_9HYPH|nr:hypothetical protein DSM25559_4444 [Agrobacterium rosae]